jgi:ABC-2 type transport system permease protein
MIKRILWHDLIGLFADRMLVVVCVLFSAIIIYGVYNGASWLSRRQALIHEAQRTASDELAKQKQQLLDIEAGRKTEAEIPFAGRPSSLEAFAYIPPTSLSALSVRQSATLPYFTSVGLYSIGDKLSSQSETDNPVNLLAGRFDLAFVIIYLYPLLILALSYNLLSAERESGTLQMVLSQPVGLHQLVLGKTLARAGLLLTLAIGVSLLSLRVSGTSLMAAGVWTRLLLWLAVIIAYTFFWFTVAVAVNAFGKSSATNATACTAIWLMLVLILPALLNVAAMTLHPLPSRLTYINRMREADNETTREGKQILARYYGDHPELASGEESPNLNDFYTKYYATQQELRRRMMPEIQLHEDQLARQQAIINRYRFLSPAIVVQKTLNDIAGTSRARHEQFLAQVRSFNEECQKLFVPILFRKTGLRSSDYDVVPQFKFREESTVVIARQTLVGLIGLLFPTLIIGGVALVKLRRYQIAG